MNQSVASTNMSTQQDESSLMMNTSGLGISTPKQASIKQPDYESPKNAAIYNMQRQYYFGGADQDTQPATTVAKTSKHFQEMPEGQTTIQQDGVKTIEKSQTEMPADSETSNSVASKTSGALNTTDFSVAKPLDSIIELNYEASSDEELLEGRDV